MTRFLLIALCAVFSHTCFAQLGLFEGQANAKMEYLSPQDGADYININSDLLIRPGGVVDISALLDEPLGLSIQGGLSGTHEYAVKVTADNRAILVDMRDDFMLDENVEVNIDADMIMSDGVFLGEFSYSFHTSKLLPAAQRESMTENEETGSQREWVEPEFLVEPQPGLYPGNIFINTTSDAKNIAIMDSAGTQPPLFQQTSLNFGNDFKVNGNGMITMFERNPKWWLVMDEFVEVIDTLSMTNGYQCDNHDFQMTSDGHAFMFAYDDQVVDMSVVVEGGDPEAIVEGFVIQELDENEDLVFEWRSWDFFDILDNQILDLTGDDINLWHINSIEIDTDGHFITSCRHSSEITKIHRTTGELIWRFGDNEQNMFTHIGTEPVSYQHDARRLDNGNLLLFDNANFTTQISRSVEFALDTVNWTATAVWEYTHPDELFGASMGGTNRYDNGNTSIYWGNVALDEYGARYTEVDADGNVLLEMVWPNGVNSYRVPKSDWFFDDSVIGCGDPLATNYDPDQPVLSNEVCIYDDFDGDGFTVEEGDCNDNDGDINPDATEIPYDGIDQDCSGADLTDVDEDGFSPEDGDCDDNNPDINPDADEIPYDGIDQDCVDGDLDDVDQDGFSPEDGDCDDNNPDINPDAEEIPNDGIDQDCVDGDLIISVDEFDSAFAQMFWNGGTESLQWLSPYSNVAQLQVFDTQGKLILDTTIYPGAQRVTINGLSKGIYTARISRDSYVNTLTFSVH